MVGQAHLITSFLCLQGPHAQPYTVDSNKFQKIPSVCQPSAIDSAGVSLSKHANLPPEPSGPHHHKGSDSTLLLPLAQRPQSCGPACPRLSIFEGTACIQYGTIKLQMSLNKEALKPQVERGERASEVAEQVDNCHLVQLLEYDPHNPHDRRGLLQAVL